MAISRRVLCLGMAISLITTLSVNAQTPSSGQQYKAASRTAEAGVVRIRVIGGQQRIDGDDVNSLVTTGVVISDTGEVLTSEFALQGNPDAVFVELPGGSRLAAKIVATDHVRRLVLLQVSGGGPWRPVQAVAKSSLRVGQYAIALGRFYSADAVSYSAGIVSALNRIHGRALQTDAKVSPVNYGGPLVDLSGHAMGILVPLSPRGRGTAGSGLEWYDSGIGFAIPMQDALESVDRLRKGIDLLPGLIGLRLKETGAFSSEVVVADVRPGGPAATAGIERGDRILKLGDRSMERPGMVEEFLLARYAGDSVPVLIERGGAQKSFTATLAAELPVSIPGFLGLLPVPAPSRPGQGGGADLLQKMLQGLPGGGAPPRPRPAAAPAAADAGPSPVRVLIVPGSPAAMAGLPAAIDVVEVNGESVDSESQLRARLGIPAADAAVRLKWQRPGTDNVEETLIQAVRRSDRVETPAAELLKVLGTVAAELAAKAKTQDSDQESDQQEAAPTPGETAGKSEAVGIRRQEIDVPEKGRVILLRSGSSGELPVAPVVLLSAHGQSEEGILSSWQAAIERYSLVLMIPVNPENAALTDADGSLVVSGLQAAVAAFPCDLRRAVVVAGNEQSSLAYQLIADPASPMKGAAVSGGWIDETVIEDAGFSGRSVLFDAVGDLSAIQIALRNRSIEQLRKVGFWVPETGSGQTFAESTGAWTIWLRCL